MGTDKGVGKKMLELMGLGVVGVATLTTARHIHEIEADVKAKLKLKKSGFDEKSGEKFLKKIDDSISLSHPSSTLRSEVLKLFK